MSSALDRVPPEVWNRIFALIDRPHRNRDIEDSLLLDLLPSRVDWWAAPPLLSLRLVSKKFKALVTAQSFGHARLQICSDDWRVEFFNSDPYKTLPSIYTRELTFEGRDREDDDDFGPVFERTVPFFPLLHTLNFEAELPTPVSHLTTLLLSQTPLHTLTGLIIDQGNYDAAVLLLSHLAPSLRHLQISSRDRLDSLPLHQNCRAFRLHFPRLSTLVIGAAREHNCQSNLSHSVSQLWSMPKLKRLGILGTLNGSSPSKELHASASLPFQLQALACQQFTSAVAVHSELVKLHPNLSELGFTLEVIGVQDQSESQLLASVQDLEMHPGIRTVLIRGIEAVERGGGIRRWVLPPTLLAYLGPNVLPNLSRVVWITDDGERYDSSWMISLVSLASRGIKIDFVSDA